MGRQQDQLRPVERLRRRAPGRLGRIHHPGKRILGLPLHFVGVINLFGTLALLQAAIILTANVMFLAVQCIDQGAVIPTDQAISQIASYISTLLNIVCVSASLILAEQHRMSSHRSAETAVRSRRLITSFPRPLTMRGCRSLIYANVHCRRRVSRDWRSYSASPLHSFTGGEPPHALILSSTCSNDYVVRNRLVSFAIAILWLCLHEASGARVIAVCVVAGISVLLLIAIIFNGGWKSRFTFSTSPLARGVRRLCRLVKRGSVMIATGPNPKTSFLPQ